MQLFRTWWGGGKKRTHHLAIVGVERLLDQREVLLAKAPLQQKEMGKHPRFVLWHKQKHCVPNYHVP